MGHRTADINVAVAKRLPHSVILGQEWPFINEMLKESTVCVANRFQPTGEQLIGVISPLQSDLFNPCICLRKTRKEHRAKRVEGTRRRLEEGERSDQTPPPRKRGGK